MGGGKVAHEEDSNIRLNMNELDSQEIAYRRYHYAST
jgi:hypothetical protein